MTADPTDYDQRVLDMDQVERKAQIRRSGLADALRSADTTVRTLAELDPPDPAASLLAEALVLTLRSALNQQRAAEQAAGEAVRKAWEESMAREA